MEPNNILSLMNIYFQTGELGTLGQSMAEEDRKDNDLRNKAIELSKKQYGNKLWAFLCDNSKEHIIAANISAPIAVVAGSNLGHSISEIASALETELKNKIFNEFNDKIQPNIDNYKDSFDAEYVKGLKKGFITTPLMVSKLKFVALNAKGIAEELRIFIGDNWDTYAISRQEAINKAFKVGKYRSNNGHDSINLNKDEFDEASKLTLETLKWFANCYIYY